MSSADTIFGVIQPKPIYRTATGQFRKETPAEFRARHDDRAWAFAEQNRLAVTAVCEHMMDPKNDPWLNLLGVAVPGVRPCS